MGTPKCEVCNEKVDWVNRDYEFLNIEVHKKCLDKFHILESDEIAVKKEKIEALIKYTKDKKDKLFFNQAIINSLEELFKMNEIDYRMFERIEVLLEDIRNELKNLNSKNESNNFIGIDSVGSYISINFKDIGKLSIDSQYVSFSDKSLQSVIYIGLDERERFLKWFEEQKKKAGK